LIRVNDAPAGVVNVSLGFGVEYGGDDSGFPAQGLALMSKAVR
jgi:hypothetical protein